MGMRMCDLVVCGLEVWGRPGSVDGNIARLLAGVIPLFATLVIGGRAGLAVHSSRNVLGAGKVNKAAHNHGIDAPKVGSFKPSTLTLPLVVQSSTDINRASSPTWVTLFSKNHQPKLFLLPFSSPSATSHTEVPSSHGIEGARSTLFAGLAYSHVIDPCRFILSSTLSNGFCDDFSL